MDDRLKTAWDELADYLFHHLHAVDGDELNDLMQFVMRVLEKEVREAKAQERSILYKRASVAARSKN